MMTVICVCVILHLKKPSFVIISVQYKASDYLNSLANQLVSLRIPDVS
jgi:hypothetical protein